MRTDHEAPEALELPERLSAFGLTRLPAGHLQVLRALAVGRDVHLFLLHPSPALWERVAEATAGRPPVVRRGDDSTATLARNRLLASWGHDSREMQLVLAAAGEHVDHHHRVEHAGDTLLARIQADVRADRPPADARPLLAPDDRSLEVHACHGRARQVEVVRDAILHVLEEDPTLEPRDVIVMCPDIETFAPLIQATFGAAEAASGDEEVDPVPTDARPPDLRVRLADRSLRQTNPILEVVARLLELADQRVAASQVLDLADREPIRRRFRLDDDDLARMQQWIIDSGIRWGLDAAHRAPFKLAQVDAGTWRKGLDRILLGVAMTEDERRTFADVLPLDDVESGAIDLAGRFAELIDRLQAALDALSAPQTIEAWAAAIATAADAIATTRDYETWQRAALQRLLDELLDEATDTETEVSLPEIRSLLAERLEGRPTRANFRTGHLTICTLHPMRSVPHRVVCLLGLDDGAFPRKAPRDGDDLMLADPHVGDRDPRTEDRQLLLDALLAAKDRLIITYTGNDERTNAPQPAAVPVGELLETVDATVRTENGPARDQVLVRHPLQPFDPRNFTDGALIRDRVWGFDKVTLAGARALTGRRAEDGPFLAKPLRPRDATVLDLDDLVRFAQHPVRAFLRQRLGISLADFSEEVEDELPVELDGLEKWKVGQRMLEARLDGVERRTACLAEIARGTLPPGVLGRPVIDDIDPLVDAIVTRTHELTADGGAPESIDVRVALPDGRTLTGTVAGVVGDTLRAVNYSRVSAKHRLVAWVRLLALTASHPERRFQAATIGRTADGKDVTAVCIEPLASDSETRRNLALEHLATLIDLYDRGMREPLPLYCTTSAAYAEAAARGEDPIKAARDAWNSGWMFDKEDREPEHQLVLGGVKSLDDLLDEPPRADEQGAGWEINETSRLGRHARRLWDALLPLEQAT